MVVVALAPAHPPPPFQCGSEEKGRVGWERDT